MVKRKQVKDGDVSMGDADPNAEEDQSDEVCRMRARWDRMES